MFIPNQSQLTTSIADCYEHDGKIFAILSDTIFYAAGGGQNADMGTINDIQVLDVFKHDGKIIHQVSEKINGAAICKLDTTRRAINSSLHSGQHLLSAVFEMDNIESGSIHANDDHFVIDVFSVLNREQLNQYEKKINHYILQSHPIISRAYDDNLDSDMNLSNYDIDKKDIKLVIIDGVEKNACGGTHLSNTSELKYLKITKHKVINDKTRVAVYVGEPAMNYVNHYFDDYNEIIKLVMQQQPDVYSFIEKKLKENKQLQKEINKLTKQLENPQV